MITRKPPLRGRTSGRSYGREWIALVGIVGALLQPAFAAPSSKSSSSSSSTPSLPKCECDAGTHRVEDKGRCFLHECIGSKQVQCTMSGVSKTFLNLGTWAATSKEIPCNPSPPPSSSSSKGVSGGSASSSKAKPPTPTPTATPKSGCPGPDEENDLGIIGDGGAIGQCQDGDSQPIPNYPPLHDEDDPDPCYFASRYCVGGCWFYDQYGVNTIPGGCP